jgi:5-deoxy-glucuronate isomerase
MATRQRLHRSRTLPAGESGTLLEITPETADWRYVHFAVRRLVPGAAWHVQGDGEEVCLVLLRGGCRVRWEGGHETTIGPRADVFSSYPWAVYLPSGIGAVVVATEETELAEGRAPSTAALSPAIVRPEECGYEIRGGGNATRQIVDILPPSFAADRLMICEVFTPSGNWSSYPPHKHDQDNPPHEVDLEEIYYFRMRQPDGYAFQRLYTADGSFDETFKVEHGDLLLVPDGYHPFVTAFGYDAYYLNVLAGERRSMAAVDDPRYASLREAWPPPDPRLPVVPRPQPVGRP